MNYIHNFAIYLKVEKDLSVNTIKGYSKDVESFLSFLSSPLDKVDSTVIRSYIAHLSEQNMKRSSITRALSSIKSFYDYLRIVEKVVTTDPTNDVKLGSREQTLPKALSETLVLRLLESASKEGIKSRVIVELLYGLGGRVTEVASLQVEDIDFSECYVRLLGKGSKERHNPIHESCIKLIQRYMEYYGITEGYLFPHRFDKERHITREAILLQVKRIAVVAGIDKSLVSPHVFRHSCAQHLLDNGCDMAMVQEFLGHEDIATTKIYAKVTRGNKANNFKNFHPLAR